MADSGRGSRRTGICVLSLWYVMTMSGSPADARGSKHRWVSTFEPLICYIYLHSTAVSSLLQYYIEKHCTRPISGLQSYAGIIMSDDSPMKRPILDVNTVISLWTLQPLHSIVTISSPYFNYFTLQKRACIQFIIPW
jgi:hypothetical protein